MIKRVELNDGVLIQIIYHRFFCIFPNLVFEFLQYLDCVCITHTEINVQILFQISRNIAKRGLGGPGEPKYVFCRRPN